MHASFTTQTAQIKKHILYVIYSVLNYTFWDYFNTIKIYISNVFNLINKVIK